MLVDKRNRRAVELHLAHHGELLAAETGAHAVEPVVDVGDAVGVAQRKHRKDMLGLLERPREVAPHALSGRKRVGHIGILGLKPLKLLEEHVELAVGNFRRIEHIVSMVMVVQLGAELKDALLVGGHCMFILR